MADEANDIDPSLAEQPETGLGNDAALAEQFRRAGTGGDAEDHEEISSEETQGETPGISLETIQSQLDELRTQNETLRIENDVYKQGLLTRPREIIRETAPAPTVETKKTFAETIDVNALNEGLRTNPAATIAKLIKDSHAAAREEILAEAVEKSTSAATGLNSLQRGYQQDQQAAMTEFGDLLQNNQEFKNLSERIYEQLVGTDGVVIDKNGNTWKPNAIYSAMSIAHSQMIRSGKLKIQQQEQADETPAPTKNNVFTLTPKKKAPVDSMLGDTKPGLKNQLLDGLSADDIQQMRRAAAGLNIPFDRYVKTFRAMQKRDPGFGRG